MAIIKISDYKPFPAVMSVTNGTNVQKFKLTVNQEISNGTLDQTKPSC